ncbi:MAG: hypothetical protein KGI38_01520 [Thaumarchaeota archaeon]|nr:hypothetical protein [Nitrososphaerota archaeon]
MGPTQPVCYANATWEPAPSSYDSIGVVITDSSGRTVTCPVNWVSDGCYVMGSLTATLEPGSYSLNLTSCGWMGCRAALPKGFEIYSGTTTSVDVSIFTGIA